MTDISIQNPERLVVVSDSKVDVVRRVLHSNGIFVNIRTLSTDGITDGYSEVLVSKSALPAAVRIIDSGGVFSVAANPAAKGVRGTILIPVDFSPLSKLACTVGFQLAVRLGLHPVLLHAYVGPMFASALQFDGDLTFDEAGEDELEESESVVANESERKMRQFRKDIIAWQKAGEIENIGFSTRIASGVPEDVIDSFCRVALPKVIVMATRHRQRRQQDMVGSVTVEVLDTCRIPIFAVPEDYAFPGLKDITRLLFFCNLDRHDIDSIDNLMKMFSYPEVEVSLVPANVKDASRTEKKMESLCRYLNDVYPTASFSYKNLSQVDFREQLETYVSERDIQMVIVPNKKTNIFSRLFRPGIAHKILFDSDIPVLSLPV